MKLTMSFLILAFWQVSAFGQYDTKAYSILEAMSKKYKSYTSFEATLKSSLTNESDGVKEEFSGKISVKGQKFHLDMGEQVIINNGSTVWTYLPGSKEVNVDNVDKTSEEFAPAQFYDMYKKGFKYLYLGESKQEGVLCDEIDLVPEKKGAQYFKVKLFIEKKDKSIQSWTMYDRAGNKYKYSISKFSPNITLKESLFTFEPKNYPGVEVIDLR